MTMSSGTRLGPYEIVAPLGAGGTGEVWRARDTLLDRSVAIKVLPAAFADNAQLKMRFEREAKTISQLNDPHICTLYDVGHDNGATYLVMEWIGVRRRSDTERTEHVVRIRDSGIGECVRRIFRDCLLVIVGVLAKRVRRATRPQTLRRSALPISTIHRRRAIKPSLSSRKPRTSTTPGSSSTTSSRFWTPFATSRGSKRCCGASALSTTRLLTSAAQDEHSMNRTGAFTG